ncbi:MAG: cytochrome c biogenesis protein [Bacteroidia bacterium]|jgi:heme exporter protein C|nr:cytochrome c biogenesis protein [Bacteroidia bacterium]
MKNLWYKILSVVLILFSIIAGLLNDVPRLAILNESIRNLYFHVPMWFVLLFQMSLSLYYALKFLSNQDLQNDLKSVSAAQIGFFFSIPGIITGMLWAKVTWGTYWTFSDPKLNGVAMSILVYTAYFILRNSIDDEIKKAKLSAVYNIFAYVMMMVFIMILPRLTDSLHPGNGGNPAFSKYDLNNNMRIVFYPAVLGWILFSIWLLEIKLRIKTLQQHLTSSL